jgi:hypothetical protein
MIPVRNVLNDVAFKMYESRVWILYILKSDSEYMSKNKLLLACTETMFHKPFIT